jgi:hypothetical protein
MLFGVWTEYGNGRSVPKKAVNKMEIKNKL